MYVAVCGRRDAVLPRNVQKDEEASLTWVLKDEVIARGKVYYAKLARGKATFVAPRLVPHFNAVWGMRRAEEPHRLSRDARAILRVLRREWEMATGDLRDDSGVRDRVAFTRALDELQAAMLVIPSAVHYQPKFTYVWTLAVSRFPDQLACARAARGGASRDRAGVPARRGHDHPGRARARDGAVEARCRPRQSRAGGRGRCDVPVVRRVLAA